MNHTLNEKETILDALVEAVVLQPIERKNYVNNFVNLIKLVLPCVHSDINFSTHFEASTR